MSETEKLMRNMEAEINRLRDWKESAMTVIHNWEAVGAALEVDKIGPLGESKAAIALREVVRLREVNAELMAALEFAIVPDHPIGSDPEYLRKIRTKAKAAIAKARSK